MHLSGYITDCKHNAQKEFLLNLLELYVHMTVHHNKFIYIKTN
jgi:hypothetical protein